MAEAVSVVSFLLQNLPQLLEQEARFLDGVKDQVNSFQNQLNLINDFLEESGEKRDKHKISEDIVRQIRDAALRGEDVIDLYIYNAAKQMRRRFTAKFIKSIPYHKNLHTIGMKIEIINLEIEKIYKNKEQYVIAKTTQEAEAEAKAAEKLYNRRYAEEDEVVGFDHNSTKLLNQLTEGKLELDVSSIFGMGGLGKTTLARKVYKDDRVKKRFNCRIWVCISQDFRRKELLIAILNSAMQTSESNIHLSQDLNKDIKELQEELWKSKLEDLNEEELKEKLARYLSGKTYLVVMDDVWTTDVWDEVGDAFPKNVNGSRILITSRNKKVVLHARQRADTPPYSLPFLTAEESWELLRKKVFRGEECPSELKIPGKEIAKSCNGVPLSIVVLASLLASKEKEEHTWEEFHSTVKWHLSEEKERCEAILALSYTQLPQYLKPCFLYFGLYPKNFEIPVRQLIQLWIAEGFIKNTGGSKMEDVAENYLGELIDRCLIQVASRRTGGGAKTCRIHDLLRDLCLSESMKEKFLKVCTEDVNSSKERTRMLSVLCGTTQYICSYRYDPPCARSLLFLGQNIHSLKDEHWKWVFKCSKFVRVLNLGRTTSRRIPDDIENLMFLKYLRIEAKNLCDIPSSICNLRYLETLDARGSTLNCLPDRIWKLQRLRNLYLSGSSKSFPPPFDTVVTLSKLQILSTVTIDPQIMEKFPNLRKLGMKPELQSEETLESLYHLRHLQILKITDCSGLPSGANSLPPTITKITLINVHFESMTMLGNLPKLRVLKLQYCRSDNLSCAADSFQQLKVLKFEELSITEWKLGRGAMPRLTHLVIKKCTSLTLLPEELYKKTFLLNVEVLWTTLTLARMLQELKMKMKFGFEVEIHPPLDDNHYKTYQ